MYRNFFKRIFDLIIALICLILSSPLIIVTFTVLSYLNNSFKVFFIQKRPGKNSKIFKLYKFKTMSDKKDNNGNLLPDKDRITPIGKFIRATSLDEIPQLLNVIKGDMSLIGPRPLLVAYLPLYSKEQARRHEVRPGITGWAQVNGRNLCKLSKKFEYDVWYVDNMSFLLDIKIIYLTIKKIFTREDIGSGNSDMEEVDDLNFAKRILK